MSDGPLWEVVGGGDKGGIIVRAGKETSSAQEKERLSTGAQVRQLALEGERLQYEKVTGTGPATGWVSIKLKDKELLVPKEDATADAGEASATESRYRLRLAVNIDQWTPAGDADGEEFQFLLQLIPEEAERKAVMKYKFYDDKKRALMSRLLMRQSSAMALGRTSFKGIEVSRTKGRKPFLQTPLPPVAEAPNFNVNVSHEGAWVVCASEPLCVCGVDVAELRRLKPNGEPIDFYKGFADQLSETEWADVRKGGPSLDDQYEVFSRYWAAKEAFTKARGDGLGFPLGDAEFKWTPLPGAPAGKAYAGTVAVKGKILPAWRLVQHKMPCEKPHWVTVARGPTTDVVDAKGEFTKCLRKPHGRFSPAQWTAALNSDSPEFEVIPVGALVPAEEMEGFVKAGGTSWP
mmetsp:Transcript_22022/g.42257  ORF Transcript_22022/g.42257 Transcript_22022/m.42257 type:complete len:405 (+) Transcript_22022:70-1284(+)